MAEDTNARVTPTRPENVVGDKGYHSNEWLKTMGEYEVRSYISEPDRGRRRWKHDPEAQQAVYGNRRRIRSEHGKNWLRRRGDWWNAASHTHTKPAACGGCICAVATTSRSGC